MAQPEYIAKRKAFLIKLECNREDEENKGGPDNREAQVDIDSQQDDKGPTFAVIP